MVRMTRKHFDLIAGALSGSRLGGDNDPQYLETVKTMAGVLQHTNQRFDFQTFYEACGVIDNIEICGVCFGVVDDDGFHLDQDSECVNDG